MSDVALRDCGRWFSGGTPDTENPSFWGGDIPWITSSSLRGRYLDRSLRQLTKEGVASGSRLVGPGTLIFVVRGMSLKNEFRVGISTRPLAFGQDCKALVPAEGIDSKYLLFALEAAEDRVLRMVDEASHGTGRLQTSLLGSLEVRVPPLEEQRRIAEILDTIDETTQATDRVIAKLTVTASGLASAAVAAAIAGARIRSIGQLADGAPGALVQTGPFGSQLHASDYVGEGVPTFMPTDIANGRLDVAGAAKITESKANELGRHRLRSGDVLFGRRGDLSRCAVVPGGATGGLCGTGCLLVRIPNDVVAADWLALVYRHDYVQRQVLGRAVGSTMLNLSGGLIRSLLIPLPTEESELLMAAFRSTEQRLEAESNRLSKLRELRRGLASDLLSGSVRTVAA